MTRKQLDQIIANYEDYDRLMKLATKPGEPTEIDGKMYPSIIHTPEWFELRDRRAEYADDFFLDLIEYIKENVK